MIYMCKGVALHMDLISQKLRKCSLALLSIACSAPALHIIRKVLLCVVP